MDAIFHDGDVPDQWRDFIPLNAEMALKSPQILEKKPPLASDGCDGSVF